jgi:hypothetical protein
MNKHRNRFAPAKHLCLRPETLRRLDAERLADAVGGRAITGYHCPTISDLCTDLCPTMIAC